MNDALKNPLVVLVAGLLLLWLLFSVLKAFVNMFWIVALAFVILYFVNDRFRRMVRMFFSSLFRK